MKRFGNLLGKFLIALVALALAARLLDVSCYEKEKYSRGAFENEGLQRLMQDLIDDLAIGVSGGDAFLDEERARDLGYTEKQIADARSHLKGIKSNDGNLSFDKTAGFILNPNPSYAFSEPVIVGDILDRDGNPLAQTIFDEKTGRMRRVYPLGPALFHLVGYRDRIIGSSGLEKNLNPILVGELGPESYLFVENLLLNFREGHDVILTLDADVQRAAFEALEGKRGVVGLLDLRGGVIALVSSPSFDPNTRDAKAWQALAGLPDNPMENRAFKLYWPGSAFKVVTAASILENPGLAARSYTCTGYDDSIDLRDLHAHGTVNLARGLIVSCNLFFGRAGPSLGIRLRYTAEKFGFNRPVDLLSDLPFAGFSLTAPASFAFVGDPSRDGHAWDKRTFHDNPGLAAQGAIGQNPVKATILQMAMIAAQIANGGKQVFPHVVKIIVTSKSETVYEYRPMQPWQTVIDPKIAGEIAGLMARVMTEGTGRNVPRIVFENGKYVVKKTPGKGDVIVRVAGKTGTAMKHGRETHGRQREPDDSVFIGFAPADHPTMAVAVIVEDGGFGAQTAAPIAMEVIAAALNKNL